ncbi:MAG: chloride channel protein [Deltaproteobacteria bacterium]|nr:chloride channel protein [Deltaproteobacteria bacterium]
MLPGGTKIEKISYRVERYLGEHVYLLVLAAIIGVLGGFGAVLFREMIGFIQSLGTGKGTTIAQLYAMPWYYKVITPAVGGLIVGPIIYFFAREAKGHGIPEVMNSVSNRGGHIRKRVVAIKTIASAITIGSGGSVGREGPIVQIGAGVGSAIGQALGFKGHRLIVMLGCGAAAGMAATFNAPIAGVILAVEIIIGSATINVFSPLVVASVSGTIVTRLVYGDETFITVPDYALVNPAVELPLYLLLGVISGFAAILFIKGIVLSEDLWDKLPVPEWIKPMFGGAIVGGVALIFPHILGVGYETVFDAVHGTVPLWILGSLILVKIFASGTSLGSGGSGGVFAPSLFVGACVGGAFGLIAEKFLPGMTANSGAYALVGMGAVLAGSIHAPITAILMLFEISGNYTIILPLMFACIISLVISSRIMPTSIFTTRLKRRGVKLRGSKEGDVLNQTRVERLLKPLNYTVLPVTPLSRVIDMAISSHVPQLFVADKSGYLMGEISLMRIKALIREQSLDDILMLAVDVMNQDVATVKLNDTLDEAMSHISRMDIEIIPVVNDDNIIVGSVTRRDIMLFFEQEILKKDVSSMKFVQYEEPDNFNLVELPPGQKILTVRLPEYLNNSSLIELDWRAKRGIMVIGIKRTNEDGEKSVNINPETKFETGDMVTVLGDIADVARFSKEIKLKKE